MKVFQNVDEKRTINEWSHAELVAFLDDCMRERSTEAVTKKLKREKKKKPVPEGACPCLHYFTRSILLSRR